MTNPIKSMSHSIAHVVHVADVTVTDSLSMLTKGTAYANRWLAEAEKVQRKSSDVRVQTGINLAFKEAAETSEAMAAEFAANPALAACYDALVAKFPISLDD